MSQSFILQENHWYGWQMLPGYTGQRFIPYCCPIFVQEVKPLKSGAGLLQLRFWNTGYTQGVQDFTMELKVVHRSLNYLIALIIRDPGKAAERSAIISHIEFGWIEQFCPSLWHSYPPHSYDTSAESSVSIYLDSVFNKNSR